MAPVRSHAFGPAAWTAALLAIGLVAFANSGGRTPSAPAERATRTAEVESGSNGKVDLEAIAEESAEGTRSVAPVGIVAMAPSGNSEGQPPADFNVEVVIEENPWLAETVSEGVLRWGRVGARSKEYPIKFTSGRIGIVTLPAAPSQETEFHGVVVEGLVLKPQALRVKQTVDAAPYELTASLESGAILKWVGSATERPPVNVTLGGSYAPSTRKVFDFKGLEGLVKMREGLELPVVLPRLVGKENVWVGASGLVWGRFQVALDATAIEVSLLPAATLLVFHDPPAGDEEHFVFARAFPGGTDAKAFRGAAPIDMTERPATTHEVWITAANDIYAAPVSRIARFTPVAGETTVVDLTEAHAGTQLGGLRVHVKGSAETLKLAEGELGATIAVKCEGNADDRPRWERGLKMWEVENGVALDARPDELIFEAKGLEPRAHIVWVNPFGASITEQVVAGQTRDVYVDLDDFGWVELIYPSGIGFSDSFGSLVTEEAALGDKVYVDLNDYSFVSSLPRRPAPSGTYTAHVYTPFDGYLMSVPFVVRKGESIKVTLEAIPSIVVNVEARDGHTNEPISIDPEFWETITFTDGVTGKSLVQWTSIEGEGPTHTTLQCQLTRTEAEIKVTLPEHPLWTFDPPALLLPQDTSPIVIRGRPRVADPAQDEDPAAR